MEKSKTVSDVAVRPLASIYLYNMLQDFRHLLIFDLRNDFEAVHIRDAYHLHPGLARDDVNAVIELAERKAVEKEKKYPTLQKVRRFFFVDHQPLEANNEGVQFALSCLQEKPTQQDKFYRLADPFSTFATTYPFLLLDSAQLKAASERSRDDFDRLLLYPYAKFPAEIVAGKLYVGSIHCANSPKMLEDLQIRSLVDFVDYPESQKVAESKTKMAGYRHWPINPQVPVVLDFDVICRQIDQLLLNGRVLLSCREGESISPCLAIAYLMFKVGLAVTPATLKVCQAISRVELDKMVYGQLLIYKPKK